MTVLRQKAKIANANSLEHDAHPILIFHGAFDARKDKVDYRESTQDEGKHYYQDDEQDGGLVGPV